MYPAQWRRSRANQLRYPPGKGWRYSNIGYLRVRQLIERTTKMSLNAALSCAVFEPLGIRNARLARERADLRGVGLVVTEVSKVPIWKAFSINGLRHGMRSNLLIL
jgi:CubicO group peptidase (beta-lactamase class C family)